MKVLLKSKLLINKNEFRHFQQLSLVLLGRAWNLLKNRPLGIVPSTRDVQNMMIFLKCWKLLSVPGPDISEIHNSLTQGICCHYTADFCHYEKVYIFLPSRYKRLLLKISFIFFFSGLKRRASNLRFGWKKGKDILLRLLHTIELETTIFTFFSHNLAACQENRWVLSTWNRIMDKNRGM